MTMKWHWMVFDVPDIRNDPGCANCGWAVGKEENVFFQLDPRDSHSWVDDALTEIFLGSGIDIYDAWFCHGCKDLIEAKLGEIANRKPLK